ncbi:hypothetical protein CFP56_036809 [Quercus suber]|uniref:Uncharacterized protein n=1 Tax=Quercus suber TaxID=58331 RepID=A0AAW0MCZ1_QUESU
MEIRMKPIHKFCVFVKVQTLPTQLHKGVGEENRTKKKKETINISWYFGRKGEWRAEITEEDGEI